ncbi:peptide chain release factor N(5)-glutamine methyltransferase [Sulfurimonas sp. HSL3-7]|uniref:peptide chain release factor N(5)-glutamine methyltransferase n=1 Tax=Sulfonitrofixus jiaomeiensis TaxID=3131938 RepID=UPI0031F8368D
MQSVGEWLRLITAELQGAVERPRREAQLLIMALLEKDELWLMTHEADIVEEGEKLASWVERRKKNEPIEYITNRVSFYSQEFHIEPGALIPRPETELLIDEVLALADRDAELTIVEIGVGSGIISTVLAQELPKAKIIAVDISPEALKVAKKNIECFGLGGRIELRQGDLLEPVSESIDILVSNPPYIANDEPLESNLDYEPDLALFGGEIGDEIIKRLLDAVFERGIRIFACEMGYDQKPKVQHYLEGKRYNELKFYEDLAGLDRGFVLKT